MTVNELISKLLEAQTRGQGDEPIYAVSASSGDPDHKQSAMFPLLGVSERHGAVVISNYVAHYVAATFADKERDD